MVERASARRASPSGGGQGGGRLVIFALGTFHAAALIAALVLVLYTTGALTSLLSGLSTIAGLAVDVSPARRNDSARRLARRCQRCPVFGVPWRDRGDLGRVQRRPQHGDSRVWLLDLRNGRRGSRLCDRAGGGPAIRCRRPRARQRDSGDPGR